MPITKTILVIICEAKVAVKQRQLFRSSSDTTLNQTAMIGAGQPFYLRHP